MPHEVYEPVHSVRNESDLILYFGRGAMKGSRELRIWSHNINFSKDMKFVYLNRGMKKSF